MEAQGNNGATESLNKPKNLFFLKRVWLLWHELSIQNLYRLSKFGFTYVLFFKQFYLVSVAEKFPAIII